MFVIIIRLIDNGWASMMAIYAHSKANAKYTVFSPYVSRTNSFDEETIFADQNTCPTVKNKWLCDFLPTTNCSLPHNVIISC